MEGIWLARPDERQPGTPVAVKDLLDTAGLVTTYGALLGLLEPLYHREFVHAGLGRGDLLG